MCSSHLVSRFRPGLFAGSLSALALALLLTSPTLAKKSKGESYVHPDFAGFRVQKIGVLPVTMLQPAAGASTIVQRHVEHALATTGYRFLGEASLRSTARSAGAAEQIDALEGTWKRSGTLDSTALRALGQVRVADAALASMITTWERQTIDFNVTGSSFTQIGVRLALYSTHTGELLWSGVFLEKGEGPYNNPGENVVGVSRFGLTPEARTSTALDPPSFEEVATKIEKQIRDAFPPAGKAGAETAPAKSTPAPSPGAGAVTPDSTAPAATKEAVTTPPAAPPRL